MPPEDRGGLPGERAREIARQRQRDVPTALIATANIPSQRARRPQLAGLFRERNQDYAGACHQNALLSSRYQMPPTARQPTRPASTELPMASATNVQLTARAATAPTTFLPSAIRSPESTQEPGRNLRQLPLRLQPFSDSRKAISTRRCETTRWCFSSSSATSSDCRASGGICRVYRPRPVQPLRAPAICPAAGQEPRNQTTNGRERYTSAFR